MTASQARDKAREALKSEYKRIIERISICAGNGGFSMEVDKFEHDVTKETLHNLGYIIYEHEGGATIYWQ